MSARTGRRPSRSAWPDAAVAERVARGAALLDDKDPGWWREDVEGAIDLETLAMIHGDRCVLGQRCPAAVLARYGDTGGGARYFAYARVLSDGDQSDWAARHGFTLNRWHDHPSLRAAAWDALTAEWTRVIRERRSAA